MCSQRFVPVFKKSVKNACAGEKLNLTNNKENVPAGVKRTFVAPTFDAADDSEFTQNVSNWSSKDKNIFFKNEKKIRQPLIHDNFFHSSQNDLSTDTQPIVDSSSSWSQKHRKSTILKDHKNLPNLSQNENKKILPKFSVCSKENVKPVHKLSNEKSKFVPAWMQTSKDKNDTGSGSVAPLQDFDRLAEVSFDGPYESIDGFDLLLKDEAVILREISEEHMRKLKQKESKVQNCSTEVENDFGPSISSQTESKASSNIEAEGSLQQQDNTVINNPDIKMAAMTIAASHSQKCTSLHDDLRENSTLDAIDGSVDDVVSDTISQKDIFDDLEKNTTLNSVDKCIEDVVLGNLFSNDKSQKFPLDSDVNIDSESDRLLEDSTDNKQTLDSIDQCINDVILGNLIMKHELGDEYANVNIDSKNNSIFMHDVLEEQKLLDSIDQCINDVISGNLFGKDRLWNSVMNAAVDSASQSDLNSVDKCINDVILGNLSTNNKLAESSRNLDINFMNDLIMRDDFKEKKPLNSGRERNNGAQKSSLNSYESEKIMSTDPLMVFDEAEKKQSSLFEDNEIYTKENDSKVDFKEACNGMTVNERISNDKAAQMKCVTKDLVFKKEAQQLSSGVIVNKAKISPKKCIRKTFAAAFKNGRVDPNFSKNLKKPPQVVDFQPMLGEKNEPLQSKFKNKTRKFLPNQKTVVKFCKNHCNKVNLTMAEPKRQKKQGKKLIKNEIPTGGGFPDVRCNCTDSNASWINTVKPVLDGILNNIDEETHVSMLPNETTPINSEMDGTIQVTRDFHEQSFHCNEDEKSYSAQFKRRHSYMAQDRTKSKCTRGVSRKVIMKQRLNTFQPPEVWVQCVNKGCSKWRKLEGVHDVATVKSDWTCPQNADLNHNKCTDEEESWDADFIFTKYSRGSIVLARLPGYPSWPAMIDDDPDYQVFYWPISETSYPEMYHVVFLDKGKITRAWVHDGNIQKFVGVGRYLELKNEVIPQNMVNSLDYAYETALKLLNKTVQERLNLWSFVVRFKGKWGNENDPLFEDEDDAKLS